MIPSIGLSSMGQYNQAQWSEILPEIFDGFALSYITPNKTPEKLDFIIFDGGADVTPILYGEKLHPKTSPNPKRDILERFIFKHYFHTPTKYIGICRGSQFINVMMNGTLEQHITNHGNRHRVEHINLDTELQKYISEENFGVNSTHHQAVKDVGITLMPTITHPFHKTIEGIESIPNFGDKIRAVQCHPESLNFNSAKTLLEYLFRL